MIVGILLYNLEVEAMLAEKVEVSARCGTLGEVGAVLEGSPGSAHTRSTQARLDPPSPKRFA